MPGLARACASEYAPALQLILLVLIRRVPCTQHRIGGSQTYNNIICTINSRSAYQGKQFPRACSSHFEIVRTDLSCLLKVLIPLPSQAMLQDFPHGKRNSPCACSAGRYNARVIHCTRPLFRNGLEGRSCNFGHELSKHLPI